MDDSHTATQDQSWILGTSIFVGSVFLLIVPGIFLGLLPRLGRCAIPSLWPAFRRRLKLGLSVAAVFTILLVAVGLALYMAIVANEDGVTTKYKVKRFGTAAGLSACLPILWAFSCGGVENLFGISREVAWRVHIAFGYIMIISITSHFAYVIASGTEWANDPSLVLALVAFILMLLGSLPADVYLMVPKIMRYDSFKLFHYLTPLGYILAIVHMIRHTDHAATPVLIVFLLNVAILLFWILQKIYVKAAGKRSLVRAVEVVTESCGQHIFLHLDVPGYSYKAGQWGHLFVPSLSMVPHPFTVVPGPNGGRDIQLFIKVVGKFTEQLAERFSKGVEFAPKMFLEGAYGTPVLPEPALTEAVVFVLGGVGVTPALSLVNECRQAYADNVYLYWSCRSAKLLTRCAPYLELVNESKRAICCTGARGTEALPLGACNTKIDVAEWLQSIVGMVPAGTSRLSLFCCGPQGLCKQVVHVALAMTNVKWHVHVEEFSFLPSVASSGTSGGKVSAEPTS